MIRVVVVEDHHLVRQGIIKLLESANDLDVVGDADDGTQAISLAKSLRPDVMILDIAMPQLDGLQTLAEIRKLEIRPQIVILSMHADPGMIRQALQGGALGYVIKQSVAEELIAAVRAARNGSIYLSSGISGVITNSFFAESHNTLLDRLSPREREVVRGIVEGHSTRQI